MNWNAIGAIGQAVSACAIVLVLIQLNDAREEMQLTAGRARFEGTRDMYLAQAIDSELLSAMLDVGRAARVPISPFVQYGVGLGLPLDEVFRVATYYRATWYNIQGSIESAERLSPFARADLDASIWANYHVNTISAKWYELSKPTLNPYAVRYVDNVLAQPR